MYINALYDIDTEDIEFQVNNELCSSNTLPIDKCGKYTVIPILSDNFSCEPLTIEITNIDKLPPELILTDYNSPPDSSFVEITISVIDPSNDEYCSSGLHELPYSFDSGETWTDNNKFIYRSNGKYVLTLRDKIGNTSYYDINIDNITNDKIFLPTISPSPAATPVLIEKPTDSPPKESFYEESEDSLDSTENPLDSTSEDEYYNDETEDSFLSPAIYPSVIASSDKSPNTISSEIIPKAKIITPALTPSSSPRCTSPAPNSVFKNTVRESTCKSTPSAILPSKKLSTGLDSGNSAPPSFPVHQKNARQNLSRIPVLFASSILIIAALFLILFLLRGRIVIFNFIEGNKYKFLGFMNINLTNDVYEISITDELLNMCTTGRLKLVFSPFFLLFHKNTSINVYLPNKQSYTVTAAFRVYIDLKL